MKKRVAILSLVILLLASLLTVPAFAEEAQEGLVIIKIVANNTEYTHEDFVLVFTHDESGETIKITVQPVGNNELSASRFPEGEYSFTKCALARNEEVEFDIVNPEQKLVIDYDGITSYTTRLSDNATAGSKEEETKVKIEIKFENTQFVLLVIGFPMLIAWAVFALIGRKKHTAKTVAQLLKHLMFGIVGAIIGIALRTVGGEWIPDYAIIIFCTAFPYGFGFVAMFTGSFVSALPEEYWEAEREAAEFRSADASDFLAAASTVTIIILSVLAGILGVICCPVVIIRDIVTIVKSRKYTRRY